MADQHESVATRLYRGEVSFDFIGKRKRWYVASGVVILVSIISLIFRGLTPSIDFKGGAQFSFSAAGHSISQTQAALSTIGISDNDSVVQYVGSGSAKQIRVQTSVPKTGSTNGYAQKVIKTLEDQLKLPQRNAKNGPVSETVFGASWGSQITHKAILGLVIFLVVVALYLSIRFQWKMALAAMVALLHDLLITAGIYSLVGFEVSPSTVIALLTILGYSLYDTVVVFDKVRENTHDLAGGNQMTFTEATNLAVNQTLVRSINTSIIALLPVIGLLVIGAGLLGAGSLDDLSLALLIGLASGAYSSIFIASPLVAELREREPEFQQLAKRVATRRQREAKTAAAAVATPATVTASAGGGSTTTTQISRSPNRPTRGAAAASRKPRGGQRPKRRGR